MEHTRGNWGLSGLIGALTDSDLAYWGSLGLIGDRQDSDMAPRGSSRLIFDSWGSSWLIETQNRVVLGSQELRNGSHGSLGLIRGNSHVYLRSHSINHQSDVTRRQLFEL